MAKHPGGGPCAGIRDKTPAMPSRATACHDRFCQMAAGSPDRVAPTFNRDDWDILTGMADTLDLTSTGSEKAVHVHFRADGGTRLRPIFLS